VLLLSERKMACGNKQTMQQVRLLVVHVFFSAAHQLTGIIIHLSAGRLLSTFVSIPSLDADIKVNSNAACRLYGIHLYRWTESLVYTNYYTRYKK